MCQECNGNYNNCPVCGEDNMKEVVCPECNGETTLVSDCCGESIIYHDRCSNCGDNCGVVELECTHCENKGVIYIEIKQP